MERSELAFGRNLKNLRKKAGLTRGALAERIAYSEKAVEKWEAGASVPPMATVCALSALFGVSLDALVLREEEEAAFLLGIDGGGTKTEFLLTDLSGRALQRVVLGASNPNDIGMEASKEVFRQGIGQVCEGIGLREVSMFAGLAGGTVGDNRRKLEEFFSGFGFRHCGNGSDVENALQLALNGGDGNAVIMGTGIAVFSQHNGQRHQIGGWGYLLDRGGSGFNLGAQALEAALRHLDGRGGSALLAELAEKQLGKPVTAAIPQIYQRGKPFVASFAPLVFDAFAQGDWEARQIIDRNVREAVEMIRAGYRFLPDQRAKTVICGGLSYKSDVLLPWFLRYLGDDFPLSFCTEPMVNGAVALARAQIQPTGGSLC